MILHTVNKAPTSNNTLVSCLKVARPGSAILLFEDGVYGALETEENRALFDDFFNSNKLYVINSDLSARGVLDKIMPEFKAITYPDFVELSVEYSKVQSWA